MPHTRVTKVKKPLYLTVAVVLALSTSPLRAQDPELYTQAQNELASGDTAAALRDLRQLTQGSPDFAPGFGLLGLVIAKKASEVATDFTERNEAEAALRRALELDPDHPMYIMALGTLMRKQQMYLDASRLLGRVRSMLEEGEADELKASERAELWYQLGLFAEDAYLDTINLVYLPELPVQTMDCSELGSFCLNFTRPEEFNDYFRQAEDLGGGGGSDLAELTDAFVAALKADSTHGGAFRRLAIHYVDRGAYDDAEIVSRSFKKFVPDSPLSYMMLGLIYQRTSRDSLAELEFEEGLSRAPAEIVAHYTDVTALLRESQAELYRDSDPETRTWLEELLWRKSDPLYLTPANEVRAAHLARVTFADFYYEDPTSGALGSQTERGQVYVRYGPADRVWAVRRDASREMGALGFETRQSSTQAGGRWIFWNYGWDLPNFIFEKQLRWRHASHVISSNSQSMVDGMAKARPASYSTTFDVVACPAQLARFRGAADSIIEVDIYSEIPGNELLTTPDTLDLGLFLFVGSEHTRVFDRKLTVAATPRPLAFTSSLPMLGGTYSLAFEARGPGGTAAIHHSTFDAQPFLDDELALSDLVLADAVTPKIDDPTDRRGFAIRVNRGLEFDPDLPVAVYWEVYGVEPDRDGFANYRVELDIKDSSGRNVLARVAGAFGFGEDEQIELTYERVVQWDGTRVPEYLSIEVTDTEPGQYTLTIEVTDLVRNESVTAERSFTLIEPE
jgi:GWxTD domain-containing protein